MPANAAPRAAPRLGAGGASSLANVLILGLMNFPLLRALALPLGSGFKTNGEEEGGKDPEDPTLWIYLSVAMTLVLLGGIFAGLTIAFVACLPHTQILPIKLIANGISFQIDGSR